MRITCRHDGSSCGRIRPDPKSAEPREGTPMTVQSVLDEIRERPGTGDVIPVFNPATEEQITEFKDCGPEAVNDAVARAKATAESGVWKGLAGSERAKVLWRIGELIDQNAAELAELESLNAAIVPPQAQRTL